MDEAHRLLRGRRVAVYPDMAVADIVSMVARRAGLKPGEIDPLPGLGGRPGTQINQDGISDWEFLSRLSQRTGARVRVVDGKLSFRLPGPRGGSPEVTVAAGGELLSLRATVSAGGQVPEVEVRGWDYQNKQEITAVATPAAAGRRGAGRRPGRAGRPVRGAVPAGGGQPAPHPGRGVGRGQGAGDRPGRRRGRPGGRGAGRSRAARGHPDEAGQRRHAFRGPLPAVRDAARLLRGHRLHHGVHGVGRSAPPVAARPDGAGPGDRQRRARSGEARAGYG